MDQGIAEMTHSPATCDLCGDPGNVRLAFLREPWSPNYIIVKACAGCAAPAWRTCGDMTALSEQVYRPPPLRLAPPVVGRPE
jgi:hypothetical protein